MQVFPYTYRTFAHEPSAIWLKQYISPTFRLPPTSFCIELIHEIHNITHKAGGGFELTFESARIFSLKINKGYIKPVVSSYANNHRIAHLIWTVSSVGTKQRRGDSYNPFSTSCFGTDHLAILIGTKDHHG